MKRLLLAVLLVAGCSAAAPTPQVIVVTAAPVIQPTPQIVYVTPAPTPTPNPTASPAPSSVAGGAGAGLVTPPPVQTIKGTLTYSGDTVHDIAKTECFGRAISLGPGTQVTVRNESGTVIGTTVLSKGKITTAGCVFTFSAADIPSATFYTFDIAGIPGQPVPAAKLIADGWKVDLTLGQ